MSKRYVLSEATYLRLQDLVNNHDFPENDEQRQEWYENAVTCGNGDDTYQCGWDDGEADVAAAVLENITIEEA
jgi:hypothetical protein